MVVMHRGHDRAQNGDQEGKTPYYHLTVRPCPNSLKDKKQLTIQIQHNALDIPRHKFSSKCCITNHCTCTRGLSYGGCESHNYEFPCSRAFTFLTSTAGIWGQQPVHKLNKIFL